MATKTDEEKAREAFKQELIHLSNWGLRKKGAESGVPIEKMKKAEANNSDEMIELILEKYDEGWRPAGEILNTTTAPAKKRRSSKAKAKAETKEPEPETKEEPEEDQEEPESNDPWNDVGDVDVDDDGVLADLGLDDSEETPEPEPEPERQMSIPYDEPEISSLEDKIDQIHDLMSKSVDLLLELSNITKSVEKTLRSLRLTATEHKEIAIRAWAMLFKEGAAKPISGIGKVMATGAEKAADLCGVKVNKKK